MTRLAALSMLALCLMMLGGTRGPDWLTEGGGVVAAAGGYTLSIYDLFTGDITDWEHNGTATTTGMVNLDAVALQVPGRGGYWYDTATDTGGHAAAGMPTTTGVFCGIILYNDGVGNIDQVGCGFRVPDNANIGTTAHWYDLKTQIDGAFRWRVIKGEANNSTAIEDIIHDSTFTVSDAGGDAVLVMLLGLNENTELAYWHIPQAELITAQGGSAGSVDIRDPATWGTADECVADTASTPLLDARPITCGTRVACSVATCLGVTDPANLTATDDIYPEDSHSGNAVEFFSATTAGRTIGAFSAGEVNP